jgi:predicted protein tyrosine phosphatase
LEREIHQVTPPKHKLFVTLLQNQKQQLLKEVRTKAIGPRIIFAKEHAQRITATKDEAYGAANITADRRLHFQLRLSDIETDATPWSLTNKEHIAYQLGRKITGIISNEQI